MSKHSFPFYAEQLEMILAVTKMLNEHSEKIPIDKDYYFKVQLVEAHEGEVIGEWSDEIGPDCWEFSLAETKPKITQQQMLMHNGVEGARIVTGPIRTEAEAMKIYQQAHKNVQLD